MEPSTCSPYLLNLWATVYSTQPMPIMMSNIKIKLQKMAMMMNPSIFTLFLVLPSQTSRPDSGAQRQPIRGDGSPAPDIRLLLRAEVRRHLAHDLDALSVGTAQRADGPVAGKDQPLRAEEGKGAVEIRAQRGGGNWSRLGQPLNGRELHPHIGQFRKRPEFLGPGRHALRDERQTGKVVHDEQGCGVGADHLDCQGQRLFVGQHVTGESALSQRVQTVSQGMPVVFRHGHQPNALEKRLLKLYIQCS